MYIRVDIDPDDVLDELSDNEMIEELLVRKISSQDSLSLLNQLFEKHRCSFEDKDIRQLKYCIKNQQFKEAMVYFERIFPNN